MAEPTPNTPATATSENSWVFAGLTSSFLDLEPTGRTPLHQVTGKDDVEAAMIVPCRILQTSTSPPVEISTSDALSSLDFRDQVLVFQFRGKFHAIDHQCPHMSHPMSRGKLYDIEDFGIKLSVGIECPKHRWSFDLFTGESERGSYKMKLWEVQLRDPTSHDASTQTTSDASVKEVWIRKRPSAR